MSCNVDYNIFLSFHEGLESMVGNLSVVFSIPSPPKVRNVSSRNLLIKIPRHTRRSEQGRSRESAKRNLQCPPSLLFCLFLSFLLAPLTKKGMIPLSSQGEKTIHRAHWALQSSFLLYTSFSIK